MIVDEPKIRHIIREILEKEVKLGATQLHRQVYEEGNGKLGETAIWKIITFMAKNGELTEELLENKRKFYSLTDMNNDVSRVLDSLFKDLEIIRDKLNLFHENYHTPKSQTESNYLIRLMELTKISRELMIKQSYLSLTMIFPAFTKHKSWKSLNKTIDELWKSITANASHQIGNNNKFYQELIWSIQGYARDEHSTKLYSGFA